MAKQLQAYHAVEGRYPDRTGPFTGAGDNKLKVSKSSYDTTRYNLYYCTDISTGARPFERFGIAARSKSGQTFTISSVNGIATATAAPSWTTCSAAFGESTSGSVEFTYGHHRDNGWQYSL